MSMATNYRYEVERPGAKNLRKALKRQEERIKVCIEVEISSIQFCVASFRLIVYRLYPLCVDILQGKAQFSFHYLSAIIQFIGLLYFSG